MFKHNCRRRLLATAIVSSFAIGTAQAAPMLKFEKLWTNWSSGTEGTELETGAEIVAVDVDSNRVFVNNSENKRIDVIRLATDAGGPGGARIGSFDVSSFGAPNSVAVKNGLLAIAVENGSDKQAPGEIWFYNAGETNFAAAPTTVTVGALPDMVTFTPDGSKVLVANEGEPNADYNVDPEGIVSVIDVATFSATPIGFSDFNSGGSRAAELPADVRIFGPGASVAQDLEPEYIAVSPDGMTAFVGMQENNAIARIDLATNTVTEIQALGFKDHSLPGNEFDASNEDGIEGNLRNWPTLGMYQPDSIGSYEVGGQLYYVTANEGDARDYDGFSEEVRVDDLVLDPAVFPTAADLQQEAELGRLKTTTATGDADGDGLHEEIYSYGARSFSIRDADGNLVFDSGNLIEKIIAEQYPDRWAENRSDDKGPEPEALEIVEINDWYYALVGLERTSGFMVFDITDPANVIFQDYLLNGDDVSPEGIDWVLTSTFSRGGMGYVAVANEVSGTTTLYMASAVPVPGSLALVGLGLLGVGLRRR